MLQLRKLLEDFVSRSVGHPPTDVHKVVTDALSALFSKHAGRLEAFEEDEELELAAPGGSNPHNGGSNPVATLQERAAGDPVECYWPDGDAWLPATVLKAGHSCIVTWDEDESHSEVPHDYLRDRP